MDKKRANTSLTLTFALRRQAVDGRIAETVEPRPGRWTHHIIIEKEADPDDTVKRWLREAYDSAAGRKSPNTRIV